MGSAGPGSTRQATGNSYTPHWTTRAFDSAKLFSIQFLTVGGSGAIAKTAVAPLERVKVPLAAPFPQPPFPLLKSRLCPSSALGFLPVPLTLPLRLRLPCHARSSYRCST